MISLFMPITNMVKYFAKEKGWFPKDTELELVGDWREGYSVGPDRNPTKIALFCGMRYGEEDCELCPLEEIRIED